MMAYRSKMRNRMRSMGASPVVQKTKARARKLYADNKKKTMIFTGALLAGVAAYALGYINFSNPAKKV